MDTICGVRVQRKTVRLILKTMDPDGERLCCRYGLLLQFPTNFPVMVLKMGSPGRYCGAQTFNTKNPKYVARPYYDYKHIKQIRRIPRRIRRAAGTENSLVKDIRILLRYQLQQ